MRFPGATHPTAISVWPSFCRSSLDECIGDYASTDRGATALLPMHKGSLSSVLLLRKNKSGQRISRALPTAVAEVAPDRIVLICSTNTVSS